MPTDQRHYFDYAATSFPKPSPVYQAMDHYHRHNGASPGRGSYRESQQAAQQLNDCRQIINQLINGTDPKNVIFTLNCSDALNIAIKGIVRPGDHVITTDLDHNSILRPLQALTDHAITHTRVACDPITGLVNPSDIEQAIKPNTRLIATHHGSNVTGTCQPISAIGAIAQKHESIYYLVDAAQSLGHLPLDVQEAHIDLLAAPGHKGLLGPLGTGFLYIRPGVEAHMTTLREGGTGSASELDTQPTFMPDRFEPGSHNTPGLIGLNTAIRFILDQGLETFWDHEQQLITTFLEALELDRHDGIHLYGPPTAEHRCAVFSIRLDNYAQPQQLSEALEARYQMLTRSGLHCAPGAHQTIGTDHLGGTTRFSFGYATTVDQVVLAARALQALRSDQKNDNSP